MPSIRHNARFILRMMLLCVPVLLLTLIGTQFRRAYLRKLALDELITQVDLTGKGSVSISAIGKWSLLRHTGLDERWYFSCCFVGCNQADGDDGSFLAHLSDRALGVITEFEAIDNFYDKKNLLHINRMTNLTVLNMDLSYLPDSIFLSLKPRKLPHLTAVHMASNGFGVTDNGILGSSIIPQLSFLSINNCESVTDKSVPVLAKGARLHDLFIERTGITANGCDYLEKQIGSLAVSWQARE